MCLSQRYGALDVEPPPTQFTEVGWGWTSTTNEEAEAWAEDQFSATINVPAGYRPILAHVVWSGLKGKKENREFNFAFSVGAQSEAPEKEYTIPTYDGVLLRLSGYDWPQGVPVSGRVHGAWDGAMYDGGKRQGRHGQKIQASTLFAEPAFFLRFARRNSMNARNEARFCRLLG